MAVFTFLTEGLVRTMSIMAVGTNSMGTLTFYKGAVEYFMWANKNRLTRGFYRILMGVGSAIRTFLAGQYTFAKSYSVKGGMGTFKFFFRAHTVRMVTQNRTTIIAFFVRASGSSMV